MFFTTDPASRGLLAGCGAVVKAPASVALGDGGRSVHSRVVASLPNAAMVLAVLRKWAC